MSIIRVLPALVLLVALTSLAAVSLSDGAPRSAGISASPARQAQPGLVDFEPDASGRLPDGSVARDELPIGDQYAASHGIRFGIDADGDDRADGELPLLEMGGHNPPDGFSWSLRPKAYDRARAGYEDQLGDWLLRADLKDGQRSLLVTYENPVRAAGGQIWDIDGASTQDYEQWRVEALDATGNVVAFQISPLGADRVWDAIPWDFRLVAPPGETFGTIRIRFIGRRSVVGLAFDRFTPALDPSPTPSPTMTPMATPTRTGTPSPRPTETPLRRPSATPTLPAQGRSCVCDLALRKVPPAVRDDALTNPERITGWNRLLDPNKPGSPPWPTPGHDDPPNPRRTCLDIQNPAIGYHPLFNAMVYRAGCGF